MWTKFSPCCASRSAGEPAVSPAPTDSPTANIYDFVEGKINRIGIFLDRQEALEAVGFI